MPIVIRIPFGGGIGAVEHHSESPEAQFAHDRRPQGRLAARTRNDAYWMIQQAIASDDPVVFMEPKRRYWESGEVDTETATRLAVVVAGSSGPGADATLIAYGPMVKTCLDSADAPPSPTGSTWRSSTCGRCRRWTWVR